MPQAQPDVQHPAVAAYANFERLSKFQQMVSEIISHTEESIEQLEGQKEGLSEDEGQWINDLLEEYYRDLPLLRQFYSATRRQVNVAGQSYIQIIDPIRNAMMAQEFEELIHEDAPDGPEE
jgi:hypothetical protein